MRVGKDNIQEVVAQLGTENLPEDIRAFYEDIKEGTADFTDWEQYNTDATTKEAIDAFFKDVEGLLPKQASAKKEAVKVPSKTKIRARLNSGMDYITIDNYFSATSRVDIPEEFKKEHQYISEITSEGMDWTSYKKQSAVKNRVDAYLKKFNQFVLTIPVVQEIDPEVYSSLDTEFLKKTYSTDIMFEYEHTPTIDGLIIRELIKKVLEKRLKKSISVIVPDDSNIKAAKKDAKAYEKLSKEQLENELAKQKGIESQFGLSPDTELRKNALLKLLFKRRFQNRANTSSANSKKIVPVRAKSSVKDEYYTGQKVILKANGEEGVINQVITTKKGSFVPGRGAEEPTVEHHLTVKFSNSVRTVTADEIRVVEENRQAPANTSTEVLYVEHLDEEVKIIKTFIGFYNKEKTYNSIRNLLNRLQKAVTQKYITKDSLHVEEIRSIQDWLIRHLNMGESKLKGKKLSIEEPFLKKLVMIAGGEKVYKSIEVIKRYIGLQAKNIEAEKANAFVQQIEKAITAGKISQDDPYMDKVKDIIKKLNKYISGSESKVSISKSELNGLMGIVEGCNCEMNGLGFVDEDGSKGRIMNSMDFARLRFQTLGFNGVWKDFIGDPAPGFTAMVYGKPKYGKSYLCINWAGYLSKNFGKVLFVAKEEALEKTLQMKVEEMGVKNPNLDLSDYLPDNLSGYKFVFIDSISKLGLKPEDLIQLKKQYPQTSFIYIFQVTKEGAFRGRNDFQHDVDIVIEVPKPGHAVQYGRYNQGGEMEIFNQAA